MAKKVLAVSGGIDSMVMWDILRNSANDDVIIAHFDHGTRPSSADDANFVRSKATERKATLHATVNKLGENVSEELARAHRYDFLRQIASKYNAEIYTAHHLDDLVETIAINLLRGTGWRGLAVLDAPGIRRPFLEPELLSVKPSRPLGKNDILKYTAEHKTTFREDPTNSSDNYLRNRLRQKLKNYSHSLELYNLWQAQKALKRKIDALVAELLPPKDTPWQRAWFDSLDETVALELLRAGTLRAGVSATRPQLKNFLEAILTYAPGKQFNLPGDRLVKFSKQTFYLD